MKKYTVEQLKTLKQAKEQVPDLVLSAEQAAALQEYEEVLALPWEQAVENCKFLQGEALMIGTAGFFYYHACQRLLDRYFKEGERTRELFDEMMNCH